MSDALALALDLCRPHLPEPFRTEHARLFHAEHLTTLARRLAEFHTGGVPEAYPPPTLVVECTPPPAAAWAPFADFVRAWFAQPEAERDGLVPLCAEALVRAGTVPILLLLGQRLTPGSLTDARALPRTTDELLEAASAIHASRLTVAARALTKHLQRTELAFWGELRGSDPEKNVVADRRLRDILRDATWRNVFEHYKHGVVFEARVREGYGARWGDDGRRFIGFLEPFTPNFPLERE